MKLNAMKLYLFMLIWSSFSCPISSIINHSFYEGDLVFMPKLKPQRNASHKIAALASLFNNSFALVVSSQLNRRHRMECILKHYQNPNKLLRIKHKYLYLIPTLHIHDRSEMNISTKNRYWHKLLSQPHEFTLAFDQIGSKLLMDKVLANYSHRTLKPQITEFFEFYMFISSNLNNKNIRSLGCALSCMTKDMVKELLNATESRLKHSKLLNNKIRRTKTFSKIQRLHSDITDSIDYPKHGFQYKYDVYFRQLQKIFDALDDRSREMMMDFIWLQLEEMLDDFWKKFQNPIFWMKSLLINFEWLLSIDVTLSYKKLLNESRRSGNIRKMHVLLPEKINGDKIMDKVMLLLNDQGVGYNECRHLVPSIIKLHRNGCAPPLFTNPLNAALVVLSFLSTGGFGFLFLLIIRFLLRLMWLDRLKI